MKSSNAPVFTWLKRGLLVLFFVLITSQIIILSTTAPTEQYTTESKYLPMYEPTPVIQEVEDYYKAHTVSTPKVVHTPAPTLTCRAKATPRYSNEDLKYLSMAVYGESRGEPYEGKVGAASVIMNRVRAGYGTVKEVVLAKGQFDCTTDEAWGGTDEESIRAAKEVLNGRRLFTPKVKYFFNPKTSTDIAFINKVTVVATIGNHSFGYIKEDI